MGIVLLELRRVMENEVVPLRLSKLAMEDFDRLSGAGLAGSDIRKLHTQLELCCLQRLPVGAGTTLRHLSLSPPLPSDKFSCNDTNIIPHIHDRQHSTVYTNLGPSFAYTDLQL